MRPRMICPSNGKAWQQSRYRRHCHKLLKKLSRLLKLCGEDTPVAIFMSLAVLLLLILLIVFLVLLFGGDKCNGKSIKDRLCEDYANGLIAGDLCYQICIEESLPLDSCYSETDSDVSYRFDQSLIKLQRYPSKALLSNPISMESFRAKLTVFLQESLGQTDVVYLVAMILDFADLNLDEELNYAECNSVWQLIHVQEFFMMFLFQKETFLPHINGTCGSAFGHDLVSTSSLYTKKKDTNPVIQYFFPNYNQWLLPPWEKRAMVAIGLLEFASSMAESYNTRFYMCDIRHTNFGVSPEFEAKVVNFKNLISEQQLKHLGKNKHCYFDSECNYGSGCSLMCDPRSHTCSRLPSRLSISFICDILKDYILYDSPDEFKFRFESRISQCQSLTYHNQTVTQNIIPDKIKSILWDQIKDKPVGWLNPKKKRNKRSNIIRQNKV